MRVAILGGTGFIGGCVTRQLAEAGAEVTTIERGTRPSAVPAVRSVKADRNDPGALARALASAAPTVVLDMIAYREEDIERLLDAQPTSVERLVVISSGDVYATYGAFLGLSSGTGDRSPANEQAPLRTELFPYRRKAHGQDELFYSYDKILVERAAKAWADGATTILRLPMVYGPNDNQRRVQRYIERLQASSALLCLNAQEATWRCTRGFVEDVAAGIRLAVFNEAAAGKTFNLGEPVALSEAGWVRAIAAVLGWQGEVTVSQEAPPSLAANWSADVTVDTTLIRQVLGYDEPVGRELGLHRTVASFTQSGRT